MPLISPRASSKSPPPTLSPDQPLKGDIRTLNLKLHGIAVIPVFLPAQDIPARLERARTHFLEYEIDPSTDPYSTLSLHENELLATPSSFHHPSIRYIRSFCKRGFMRHLAEHKFMDLEKKPYHVECLFSQVSIRTRIHPGDAKFKRETFPDPTKFASDANVHEELDPPISMPDDEDQEDGQVNALPDDEFFHGWANCNPIEAQYILAVPGSFSDAPKDSNSVKDTMLPGYADRANLYEVPPLCMIVMRLGTAYKEVKTVPLKPYAKLRPPVDSRLYVNYRLTTSTENLFPSQRKWMMTQAVPRVLSGEYPPVVPVVKSNNWKELDSFAVTMFRPLCVHDHYSLGIKVPYPANHRNTRRMKALAVMGLGMYPPYTQDDIAVMSPQRVVIHNSLDGLLAVPELPDDV